MKNCVWKNEIEPLLGTFAIDLSVSGELTKTKLNLKMTKSINKSPTKLFNEELSSVRKGVSNKFEGSKIIDIEMPKETKRKPSSNIFGTQDPKYVEFVDELENKQKSRSNFLSPEKMVQTVNLNPSQPSDRNLLNAPNLKPQPKDNMINSQNMDATPIVIKAEYIKEANSSYAIEKSIPDSKKYYPLGYDLPKNRLDPSTTKKQYRLFLESILEGSVYMDKHPFDEYIITRGNKAQGNSLMSKILGLDESPRALGIFKCFVEVINEKDKNALEISRGKPLNDLFQRDSVKSESVLNKSKVAKKIDIDKEFMQANNVVIRVHILEVFNLVQLEGDSIPSPYIAVRLGEQCKTVRDNYNRLLL